MFATHSYPPISTLRTLGPTAWPTGGEMIVVATTRGDGGEVRMREVARIKKARGFSSGWNRLLEAARKTIRMLDGI